ncbi:hypothetical protein [Sphingobacterium multivorum]|uniref:hypothetical protein n=1 Tax=Sphingobacterium multivorum TaxID=28454 RepID=UPI003DA677B8
MKSILAKVKHDVYQFNKDEQVKILQYYAINTRSQHGNFDDGVLVVRKNGELATIGLSDLLVDFETI